MNQTSISRDFIDETCKDIGLEDLFPTTNREEIVYRKNGKSVDKVIEFDKKTGAKVKTTHYDYFNDNKIKSIDEYDVETGKKVRTINYVLYKSIDEYDIETGKKIRTINFNVKDETKISSIQEYDLETGKIITISIFKRDGRTVSIVKKINPETNEVSDFLNKDAYSNIAKSKIVNTVSYDNIADVKPPKNDTIANLIDNLYKDSKKSVDKKVIFNL